MGGLKYLEIAFWNNSLGMNEGDLKSLGEGLKNLNSLEIIILDLGLNVLSYNRENISRLLEPLSTLENLRKIEL